MSVNMVYMDQRFSEIACKQGSYGFADHKRTRKSWMNSHTNKIHIFYCIKTNIFDDFDNFFRMKSRSDFGHNTSVLLMILDLRICQQRIHGKCVFIKTDYPYGRIITTCFYGQCLEHMWGENRVKSD